MAYRDVVLADSPVDYYEMNTGTGTDSGSGSRTLTLTGGVTTGVAGKVGNGWSFDGVNDYASMSTFPSVSTAFTFEAWVKPNLAGVNDTPTVIRRDGTDIMLLRVRGSAIAVNPGQAEVYADGLTLVSGSSYRVDDGNWHHIVYTQSGNAAKLYVDGVERASGTTSQSTFNMGTGTGYIGAANGATEFYKGVMDEVAIYNTALSPTRVLAHYNGTAINAGYTAEVGTASALMPDAVGRGNIQIVSVTADAGTGSPSNTGNSTAVDTTSARTYFKLSNPTLGTEFEVGRQLRVRYPYSDTYAQTKTVNVYRVLSDWSEGTITSNSRPDVELVRTVSVTYSSSVALINITNADIGYGVAIDSAGDVATKENATPSYRPYGIVTTAPAQSISPAATPMTASAAAPTGVGTGGTGKTVTTTPLTASALMTDATIATGKSLVINAPVAYASGVLVDPTLTLVSHIVVNAEPMTAEGLVTGGGFANPKTVVAEPLIGAANAVDPSVEVQKGVRVNADAMAATARWKQAASVNGAAIVTPESEDKYFQRVMLDSPARWLRMNTAGSTESGLNVTGSYVGAHTGRFDGPDGRHSVNFDGSAYFVQDEPGAINDETNYFPANKRLSTLEFSIKTTKANQFILGGADWTGGVGSPTEWGPKEVWLQNGRIHYKTYNRDRNNGRITLGANFTGFKNLADGQWHTITITGNQDEMTNTIGTGVSVYVDGKLEIRRWGLDTIVGFPDYLAGRNTWYADVLQPFDSPALIPSSQWFEGDMSEVVFHTSMVGENNIIRRRYAFMGWTPIEATPAEAFAFTPADHHARGNQKRALYLWWTTPRDYYSVGGDRPGPNNTMNFDVLNEAHGQTGVFELDGYKVFSRQAASILDGPVDPGYLHPVTGLPWIIDFNHDVDIRDFDVIMFGDWPDEGYEEDLFNGTLGTGWREAMIEQIRDANELGVAVMVTHPRLAVDLGIVDRVELVPTLKETSAGKPPRAQGGARDSYDYRSASIFPWNISASAGINRATGAGALGTGAPMTTDPAFLDTKAYFFEDQNFNNKFRVRALVDGLTNIPSYMIGDAVIHREYDEWGEETTGMRYLKRLDGLQIGDEFIFDGNNPALFEWGASNSGGLRVGRAQGYFATPVANVKAGTIVTTFGASIWTYKSELENPYKEYATTITLDTGDVLAGRAVGGRIFVNFTERSLLGMTWLPADVLPGSEFDAGNAQWPNNYPPETDAQRAWDFSLTRLSVQNITVSGSAKTIDVTMPDGSVVPVTYTTGNGLVAANYSRFFLIAQVPYFNMVRRGLFWLRNAPEFHAGDKRVAAQPMAAISEMPSPTVVAQRDAGYNAQPMVALAQMPKVAEDQSGDVEIHTLPLTAHAEITGYGKTISVAPMLATAELLENFDMVHATGEQIVLTLHGVDATLYLKEEN